MTDRDPTSTHMIAQRLIATRLALGYENQVDFCRDAGVSYNTWNNYENARGRPKLDTAIQLCARFNLTLDWIYIGDASGLPHRLAQLLTAGRASQSSGRDK